MVFSLTLSLSYTHKQKKYIVLDTWHSLYNLLIKSLSWDVLNSDLYGSLIYNEQNVVEKLESH